PRPRPAAPPVSWVTRAPCRCPRTCCRIVQFRAGAASFSSNNKHLAVGQQRRRVTLAGDSEATGDRALSARRIVQFSAGEVASVAFSSSNKHLAVGQQSRRVITPPLHVKVTRVLPGSA